MTDQEVTKTISQLAIIETMTPAEIYSSGKIQSILEKIKVEVKAIKLDISTPKGRKEVASLAHKVARSKTYLDDLGKQLGEDAKKKLDAINGERKIARDELDKLKDEVREPLTLWETKEEKRIAGFEAQLKVIADAAKYLSENFTKVSSVNIQEDIDLLTKRSQSNELWDEFEMRAKTAYEEALSKLKDLLSQKQKQEAEKLELERLRAAEAARVQKERDDKIAAEAAERARIESERLARVESEKVALAAEIERQKALKDKQDQEARIYAAEKAKIDAEVRARDAEEKAERDKVAAVEAERAKVEREKEAVLLAEKKRLADREHKKKVNNEILAAINQNVEGLTEDQAKSIIFALATGKIPYTKLSY